jgi:tRNA A-37 threonylcarbamoyl transferase component Bud32
MSDSPNRGITSASELIDQLCDEFEKGWLAGQPTPLEDIVLTAPDSVRPNLFRELLAVEREYRARDGRPITPEEAQRRFACLGAWVGPGGYGLDQCDNPNGRISDSNAGPSVPSDAARIHELAEAFDAGWQPEDWVRMIELVRKAPPHLAPAVLQELIDIDVQRRLARQLTLLTKDSYLKRFPGLAADPSWHKHVEATVGQSYTPPSARTEKIGRYPVNSALATGGEAEVYLCFHPEWRKQVVVKWMRKGAATCEDWRERFARQGPLLKELEHDRIVRIYDQGECEGRPFIVTEYIQGRNLRQFYQDTRPEAAQAVAIIADVAVALGHAHRLGVYHQDVKPDNILIEDGGRAKLIDFGVAWFRPAWGGGSDPHGCTAGTLGYFSPEQASDGEVTARTDLFALGGVLYFLLTGSAPYPELEPNAALKRAIACDWDRSLLNKLEIPVRLRRVCETAMAADPRERYATAEELASAARAAIRPPWWSWRRIAVAMLFLCLFGGAAVTGRILSNRWFPPATPVAAEKPNLVVLVHRQGFDPKPLSEVVPLLNGDSLQARFRVSGGVYASLVYVNTSGRLEVLQTYEPREASYEAIWPATGQGIELRPPAGTEFLFVCGRTDRAPTTEELQAAWAGNAELPVLEPAGRFLRMRPEEITVEGTKERDLGKVVEFPENNPVKRRLEQFRDRLRAFPVLDGVAFRHQ